MFISNFLTFFQKPLFFPDFCHFYSFLDLVTTLNMRGGKLESSIGCLQKGEVKKVKNLTHKKIYIKNMLPPITPVT